MASARDVDVEAITVRLNECLDPDGWQEAFQRTRYLVLTYPFMGNVKECTSLASEITEHSRFDKDSTRWKLVFWHSASKSSCLIHQDF